MHIMPIFLCSYIRVFTNIFYMNTHKDHAQLVYSVYLSCGEYAYIYAQYEHTSITPIIDVIEVYIGLSVLKYTYAYTYLQIYIYEYMYI